MLPDVSRESFAREAGLSNVSRESLDKLTHYLVLLEKWQKAVNLISPSTLPDAWNRHFVDSAQLGALIDIEDILSSRRRVGSSPVCYADDAPDEEKVVLFDFGSGAGFPGLVLAILYPQLSVHLVESDQKKCSFLSTVSRETNVSVSIHNCRVEALVTDAIPDIISARALADLGKLLGYAQPWTQKNPALMLLLPKGENYTNELREIGAGRFTQCEEFPSKTDEKARILRISGLK